MECGLDRIGCGGVGAKVADYRQGKYLLDRKDAKNKTPVRIWTRMYPFVPGSRKLSPITIALNIWNVISKAVLDDFSNKMWCCLEK